MCLICLAYLFLSPSYLFFLPMTLQLAHFHTLIMLANNLIKKSSAHQEHLIHQRMELTLDSFLKWAVFECFRKHTLTFIAAQWLTVSKIIEINNCLSELQNSSQHDEKDYHSKWLIVWLKYRKYLLCQVLTTYSVTEIVFQDHMWFSRDIIQQN